MSEYCRVIKFYEASTLINFIKENSKRLKTELIRGIYHTSPLEWYEHVPGRKTWTTDTCIIIEFDTFAVQIDYYFWSDMQIKIVDREGFYKGELTRSIYDYQTMEKDSQPFKKVEDLNIINGPVCEFIIERFSHGFGINPANGTERLSGGDYFKSVIFIIEDIGVRICAEDSEADGCLDYELFYNDDVDSLEPHEDVFYERIML